MYRVYNTDTQKFYSLGSGWVTNIDDSSLLTSKEAKTLASVLADYTQGSLLVSLDKDYTGKL